MLQTSFNLVRLFIMLMLEKRRRLRWKFVVWLGIGGEVRGEWVKVEFDWSLRLEGGEDSLEAFVSVEKVLLDLTSSV
jgi:hypothetical protein